MTCAAYSVPKETSVVEVDASLLVEEADVHRNGGQAGDKEK